MWGEGVELDADQGAVWWNARTSRMLSLWETEDWAEFRVALLPHGWLLATARLA